MCFQLKTVDFNTRLLVVIKLGLLVNLNEFTIIMIRNYNKFALLELNTDLV